MFIKRGEAIAVKPSDVRTLESLGSDLDLDIDNRMRKLAQTLKKIAPKASDFLYFTCVMMHAAEASLLDENGELKKLANGQPVNATWEPVGDGFRWVCNDPSIRPYKNKNCFIAGTPILMADGTSKNIEDIKIGDEVVTHKNRVRKVVNTMCTDHSGDVYTFKPKFLPKITATGEHPFLAALKKTKSDKLHDVIKFNNFDWQKASDLSVGDFLVSHGGKNKNQYDDLTPGQARILGYFAAEGCFTKKDSKRSGVCFTFGYHEENLTSYVAKILAEEFPECSVTIRKYQERGITNIFITGYKIEEWFFKHVGEFSHDKILSKEIVFGSDLIKKNFLLGWIEGDGCLTVGNKLVGITTSHQMAWQIWHMLSSIRVYAGIAKNDKLKSIKKVTIDSETKKVVKEYPVRPHFRINIYGANAEFICEESVKYQLKEYNHKYFQYNVGNYRLHRINNIEVKSFTGKVYNFEVEEDHSYVAGGLVVHNCDIFPSSELKIAHKKWIGKPLCLDHKSSSVDMVRGVIVDTFYDEKKMRVVALCALDKVNYPDLARKVATGYACDVSTQRPGWWIKKMDNGSIARRNRRVIRGL
jgi:intein/homing endonuclease